MFLFLLTHIMYTLWQLPTGAAATQQGGFDLEATEVIVQVTETGERYFSYVITNVGSEPAPAGSYEVFLSVNGKVISLDTKTSELAPGKALIYTSETKFSPSAKRKPLKYKLAINTRDADKKNNRLKGIAEW